MQENFYSLMFCPMFGRLGMLLIIGSWLLQLNYSWKGRKELQPGFLILQAVGIFLLVLSSFAAGEVLIWFLNLLSCAGAIAVYLKTKK